MTAADKTAEVRKRLAEELRDVPRDRVAVLCIGNVARGDDGFGPAVAEALGGTMPGRLFNGGSVPENDLPRIASLEPQVVLMVDAVHFGGEAGELRVVSPGELRLDDFSTHSGSLSVAAEFLKGACGARVVLLAAQPEGTRLGDELGAAMQKAVGAAAGLLEEIVRPSGR